MKSYPLLFLITDKKNTSPHCCDYTYFVHKISNDLKFVTLWNPTTIYTYLLNRESTLTYVTAIPNIECTTSVITVHALLGLSLQRQNETRG